MIGAKSNKGSSQPSTETSSRMSNLGLGSYPNTAVHSTSNASNQASTSVSFGSTRASNQVVRAKFVPDQELLYGCINCQDAMDGVLISTEYRALLNDPNKSVLVEMRKLMSSEARPYFDGQSSKVQSEVIGASVLQDVSKYGLLKSTCISFRSQKSSGNVNPGIQCATGLTNGSLCIHNFNINEFSPNDNNDSLLRASLSFYPARNARPATAVAWRPRMTNHVAIGLSSHRKIGRGDREFCCLMWDVEAQHRSLSKTLDSNAVNIYSGIAPANRFSHNTSVSALSWVMDANVLVVGTFQKIQLYDIRMVGTNTPPTSKTAHNDVVSGIESDPFRPNIFATFSELDCEPVKIWDARRLDMAMTEIKTNNFTGRSNASLIKSIEWSLVNPGNLALISGDSIRVFDTNPNRPVLTRIIDSQADLECISFQPTHRKSAAPESTHMMYPHRLLTVTRDGCVRLIPKVHNSTLSLSPKTGLIAHSFGNKVLFGSSAFDERSFLYDEDISNIMMRRAKCLHINNYSTNPSSNLKMLSEELKFRQNASGELLSNTMKLWRLWKWIERVENLNEDACTMVENGETPQWPARCLTYSGVLQLMHNDTGKSKEEFSESLQCPLYESPMRSAALAACGWANKEGISKIAETEENVGNFERAAALYVFNGELGCAVDALQKCADKVMLSNSAIDDSKQYAEALQLISMCIAGYNAKSDVWRSACLRLLQREELVSRAHHFEVSYIRASCAFLCAIGDQCIGDSVLSDDSISLADRVAFACRFVPEKDLAIYLERCAKHYVDTGDLEGILLTGLDKNGISLLQSYLDNSGDIQTVALLSSRVILPREWVNERYQCSEWLESYRDLLNTWQMWHSRSKFDVGRANLLRQLQKRASTTQNSNGQFSNNSSKRSSEAPIINIPPQLYARCNYCNAPLSLEKLRRQEGVGNSWLSRQKPLLSCCPQCRKPLPRCGICLLPLGCLNPYLELKRERNSITSGTRGCDRNDLSGLANIPFAEWWTWCMSCKHGGHSHHLMGWFSKHEVCPVSGCKCNCQFDSIKTLSSLKVSHESQPYSDE